MKKYSKKLNKEHYFFILIILIAIIFRFWKLGDIPPGLYPDIAVNGTDAIRANENLSYQLFYPANNGREGLFINLIAVAFKIFGTGIWQLRLVGAIIGTLTVYGVYLLTKEILDKRSALFASLFTASSFWAVNFSRIGFRAIMVPFIIVFSLYFLLRKLNDKNKSIWDFIIAGVIFGLGFHTYISFRIAPLILAIIAGYILIYKRNLVKKYWKGILLLCIAIFIAALPILIYFQAHAADMALRTGQVSIFNEGVNKGNFLGTLLKTTSLAFGMFNFYGDPNWRHNFSKLPDLNPIVGILFIAGIVISLKSLFTKKDKKTNQPIDKLPYLLMISWLIIMLIPAILTEEGMPHSLRAIGSMIPAFMLAGLGAKYLYEKFAEKKEYLVKKITVFICSLIIIFDFSLYFVLWPKNPEVIGQFTTRYVEIAKYLNNLPSNYNKYVIVNINGTIVDGLPIPAQTIKFLAYKKSNIQYLEKESFKIANLKSPGVIIALENDNEIKNMIENKGIYNIKESTLVVPDKKIDFVIYFLE